MNEIADLVARYHAWLRDRTAVRQLRDWTEITTPFLDRHNDCLQIFAKRTDGGFVLTDDGYVLDDLAMSGCNLDSERRRGLLEVTLNGFGVRREGQSLTVHATAENFSMRKHNLLQAMLAVNDLFYVAAPVVRSLFMEDVTEWLDSAEVRYIPKVKLPGASGFDHVFDFAIPRSREATERFLKVISNPSRDAALNLAFAWHDTRTTRIAGAQAIAIVNDNERPVLESVTEALRAYDVVPLPWSLRDTMRTQIAA